MFKPLSLHHIIQSLPKGYFCFCFNDRVLFAVLAVVRVLIWLNVVFAARYLLFTDEACAMVTMYVDRYAHLVVPVPLDTVYTTSADRSV